MGQNELIERLQQAPLKVTPKRLEMFRYLVDAERYISAKEVLEYMKAKHPTMSFDTVYRNLKAFSEKGLLEATELNGEKAFRVTCASNHHHHHLICLTCGKTQVLEVCPMRYVPDVAQDFEIVDHKFEIYGYCKGCRS